MSLFADVPLAPPVAVSGRRASGVPARDRGATTLAAQAGPGARAGGPGAAASDSHLGVLYTSLSSLVESQGARREALLLFDSEGGCRNVRSKHAFSPALRPPPPPRPVAPGPWFVGVYPPGHFFFKKSRIEIKNVLKSGSII